MTAATPTALEEVFRGDVLPALPHSAIRLLQLSQSDDVGPAAFATPIEADPGLMGQVLRFVNSSYFGFSRQITSIPQAITLVGSRAITNFALWNAVFSVIPNPKFGPFDLKALWQDSLRRAVFARKVGRQLSLPHAEDLFAGALLQDMAIPLLLRELPSQYEAMFVKRAALGQRLSELENETFGWDHADAAALLATRWNLPTAFVELISQHTKIDQLLQSGTSGRSAACVALASLLPSCADEAWPEHAEFATAAITLADLAGDALKNCLGEVDTQTAAFAPLLKLPSPARTLCGFL